MIVGVFSISASLLFRQRNGPPNNFAKHFRGTKRLASCYEIVTGSSGNNSSIK